MCTCHPSIALTAKQEEAIARLRDWTSKHGTDNLSHVLTHSTTEAGRVYNACNYHFKKLRIPGLESLSNLGTACHIGSIAYEPACLRSTSVDVDIGELLALYDAGADVYDRAINKTHSRLFARLKARAGRKGWFDVFKLVKVRRPNVDFRRFFASMPENVFLLGGEPVVLETRAEIEEYAEQLLRAWSSSGGDLTPYALRADEDLRRMWERFRYHKDVDLYAVLKRLTGVPWEKREAEERVGFVPMHEADASHPLLLSGAEAVVDGVLAATVPGYLRGHRHEVGLESLIPNLSYEDSPYSGRRSPRADILFERSVLEVSFFSEKLQLDYASKVEWKLRQLQQNGFKAARVFFEDGPRKNAKLFAEMFLVSAQDVEAVWRKLTGT